MKFRFLGENLIRQKHFLAEGINSSISSLRGYYNLLKTTWKKRNELYKYIHDNLANREDSSNFEIQKRNSVLSPMVGEAIIINYEETVLF